MRPFKAILRSDAVRRAACWVVARYMGLCLATCRWQVLHQEGYAERVARGDGGIVAFWHGRLFLMGRAWPGAGPERFHMLISQHRDGELIARTIGHFGFRTVRGSSAKPGSDRRKGGAEAVRRMVTLLREGNWIGITPDGPRGPRMRASDGIVAVARLSGMPVYPIAIATSARRLLGTWDRFQVPLPFSRAVLIHGEPIEVPRKAAAEEFDRLRLDIEQSLIDITQQADRMVGGEVVEPADPVEQQA